MFVKEGGRHGRLRARCRRRVSGDPVRAGLPATGFRRETPRSPLTRLLQAPPTGGCYFLVGSFLPNWSWLETQSIEAIAEASEISPASTVPATISANLYTLPMP